MGMYQLRVTALAAVVGAIVLGSAVCTASFAADPASGGTTMPAVDGINAKLSGFGGSIAGQAYYGGDGAITVPLGTRFGLQLDGLAAGFNSSSQGGLSVLGSAAHLFWRDPSIALLGVYGAYVHTSDFGGSDFGSGAGEGHLYLNRVTIGGLVGVQGGSGNPARFFDIAQLAYYPIDNLRGWVGQSYMFGRSSLSLGAEFGISIGSGTMPALFATGSRLEDGSAAVIAGVRLYLGQRDKSLIRRHREDDPPVLLSSPAAPHFQCNFGDPHCRVAPAASRPQCNIGDPHC